MFIYLLTSVPAIWFLELHEFERRVGRTSEPKPARVHNETAAYLVDTPPSVSEDLSAPVGSVLGVSQSHVLGVSNQVRHKQKPMSSSEVKKAIL